MSRAVWEVFRAFAHLFVVIVSLVALILFFRAVPDASQWADCARFGALFVWAWLNRLEDAMEKKS